MEIDQKDTDDNIVEKSNSVEINQKDTNDSLIDNSNTVEVDQKDTNDNLVENANSMEDDQVVENNTDKTIGDPKNINEKEDKQNTDDIESNESVISIGLPSDVLEGQPFVEQQDEVQLVVSKHSSDTTSKSPLRISNALSPERSARLSSMSHRLHKMGRPSIEASQSLSTLSKEDSPSNMNVVTITRLNDIPQQDKVEVVQNEAKEAKEEDTATKKEVEQEEKEDKENAFKVPEWATSPELEKHLEKQTGMDPDKIFGRMPPIQIEEIFPFLSEAKNYMKKLRQEGSTTMK
ncbi:MAG: hypothetical protein EXX96DRAFT_34615 [Benjaminiella poitrasii]|nr:MAG: hypothetical protein EXX96DRAFT_34615 [Benjaminiella poitrasii]